MSPVTADNHELLVPAVRVPALLLPACSQRAFPRRLLWAAPLVRLQRSGPRGYAGAEAFQSFNSRRDISFLPSK